VQNDATPLPAPIACPYCGRPLKWTTDHWREAFEGESCGKFSYLDSATSSHREIDTTPRLDDHVPAHTETGTKDLGRKGSGRLMS
jgi:hypothetical protein